MTQRFILLFALSIFLNPIPAFSQQSSNECTAFLQKPVFTSVTIDASSKSKDDFRLLQCSASWKSASDAQSAGIDATIPVYGIPVPISANWDQNKVEQWKNTNCTQSERSSSYATSLYQTVYSIDPITAKAAVACMQSRFATEQTRAIRCTLTETSTALLFQAEWRRSPGEQVSTAPVVKSFSAVNTTCQNAGDLSSNKQVPEGGVSLLCSVEQQAAAFSLNTNRGQCVASSTPRLPKITLPSNMVLDKPMFLAGTDIEISAGSKIITNGYPLTINTDRLTIAGPAEILSFSSAPITAQTPGHYAGVINISAKEVVGKGLTILNDGEPGGDGLQGAGGPPGQPGGPGKTRLPQFQQNCGGGLLDWICQAVPAGCTGGQDGGPGGQGVAGYPGNPGAPGGGAGDVKIDVPIDARDAFSVLVDLNLAGQHQDCGGLICGGLAGEGGPGGPGGAGGPGGPGASGTMHCGGTNGGPTGHVGPTGPKGPRGQDGSKASVRFL